MRITVFNRPTAFGCLRRPALAVALAIPALPSVAVAYDYPTIDRVRFVQQCMREHPGPSFEMMSKCSCTIDRIAEKVPLEDFVSGSTAVDANSISGERGNTIRDTEMLQGVIKSYRALLADSKKSCFIGVGPR